MAALRGYPWPGNIRELENVIERLVIVKGSGTLMPADLPPRDPHAARRDARQSDAACPSCPTDGTDLRAMLEAVEERMIGEALERTGGNKNRAAELLGLEPHDAGREAAPQARRDAAADLRTSRSQGLRERASPVPAPSQAPRSPPVPSPLRSAAAETV